MNRITKKEIEWYDDFVTSIEDEYDIDETNDVMYRKLKAVEDIEEEFGIGLFILINNFKKNLEVLEILKKWIVVNETYDDLFPYEIKVKKGYVSNKCCLILTKEDFKKIKEWLENE